MSIIQQIREKAAWLVFGSDRPEPGRLSFDGCLCRQVAVCSGDKLMMVGVIDGEKVDYPKISSKGGQQPGRSRTRPRAKALLLTEPIQQTIRENVWKYRPWKRPYLKRTMKSWVLMWGIKRLTICWWVMTPFRKKKGIYGSQDRNVRRTGRRRADQSNAEYLQERKENR